LISAFKNKGKSKQMEKWLQRANYFEWNALIMGKSVIFFPFALISVLKFFHFSKPNQSKTGKLLW
jgi:ABC-type molybdate transport system permease subunit